MNVPRCAIPLTYPYLPKIEQNKDIRVNWRIVCVQNPCYTIASVALRITSSGAIKCIV